MTWLVTHVRLLIDDPAGADAAFSDEELQSFLDGQAVEVRYERLTPLETRVAGGAVVYTDYRAACGFWESAASLTDETYAALTATSEDARAGAWTFTASTAPPVYVTGRRYAVYAACVDVLGVWLAQLKGAYDFTADGATFRRSQQAASVTALLARYEAMAGPRTVAMVRDDMVG
jgi:hypothetical protein